MLTIMYLSKNLRTPEKINPSKICLTTNSNLSPKEKHKVKNMFAGSLTRTMKSTKMKNVIIKRLIIDLN